MQYHPIFQDIFNSIPAINRIQSDKQTMTDLLIDNLNMSKEMPTRGVLASITQEALSCGIDDAKFWELANEIIESMENDLEALEQ